MNFVLGSKEAFHLAYQILTEGVEKKDTFKKKNFSIEAEQLVQFAYERVTHERLDRLSLYGGSFPFPSDSVSLLMEACLARKRGKPLQYITQTQFFWEHSYQVGPEVLIPRPETEILLETAFRELSKQPCPPQLGLEIGLGSGILSIELLVSFSKLVMFSSEWMKPAGACALRNAVQILGSGVAGAERLCILFARHPRDIWGPFEGKVERADFLITNPPYLDRFEPSEVDAEVLAFEPKEALFPFSWDPLFFYYEIAKRMREFLSPKGILFCEIAHERSEQICSVFQDAGFNPIVLLDLNQKKRVLVIRLEDKSERIKDG